MSGAASLPGGAGEERRRRRDAARAGANPAARAGARCPGTVRRCQITVTCARRPARRPPQPPWHAGSVVTHGRGPRRAPRTPARAAASRPGNSREHVTRPGASADRRECRRSADPRRQRHGVSPCHRQATRPPPASTRKDRIAMRTLDQSIIAMHRSVVEIDRCINVVRGSIAGMDRFILAME